MDGAVLFSLIETKNKKCFNRSKNRLWVRKRLIFFTKFNPFYLWLTKLVLKCSSDVFHFSLLTKTETKLSLSTSLFTKLNLIVRSCNKKNTRMG